MQEIYNTYLALIIIATAILPIAHLGIHNKTSKFHFPMVVLPLTALAGLFFWVPLHLFNTDKDWKIVLLPLIIGLAFSIFVQTFNPKAETAMASITLLPLLIIYRYFSNDLIFIMGIFIIGLLIGNVLRLLRAEKYLGNALISVTTALPVYAGFVWLNALNLPEKELNSKILLMIAVAFLAIVYSFTINLFKNDKRGFKRQGTLIITALLVFLIINNYLNMNVHYIYLIVGGFVFAQILEVIHSNKGRDKDALSLEVTMGLGLILLVGFILTRLFGIWGLILISLCCIATAGTNSEKPLNWPAIASLFFASKAIVHIFINQTTLNITGLNLNHPYVYVGLMIGLIIPFAIIGFTLAYKDKFASFNFLIVFIFGLTTPLLANYLIHSEASGSMILGLSISALLVTIGGKVFGVIYDNKSLRIVSNSILPLTGLIGLMVIINQQLIEIGNIASRIARAETFIALSLLIIIIAIVQLKITEHTEADFYPEKTT